MIHKHIVYDVQTYRLRWLNVSFTRRKYYVSTMKEEKRNFRTLIYKVGFLAWNPTLMYIAPK